MIIRYVFRLFLMVVGIAIVYGFLLLPKYISNSTHDKKNLHIYVWTNRFDESLLKEFEKKTGIQIIVSYYDSAEELLTKLELMPNLDCDLMLPSGTIISQMIHKKLIKPIDHERCGWKDTIYSEFLNLSYDPENRYSFPLYWDVFGLGYNKARVGNNRVDLPMLFDKHRVIGDLVGMTEDARETLFLAACYLGYPLTGLTQKDLKHIQQLLVAQKAWVGAYSDSQQGYFLKSDTFAVVAADREIIARQMIHNDHIGFALPKRASMLRTDSFVINATTQKEDYIYQFLDFIFDPNIVLEHAQKYCILPTVKQAFEQLDVSYIGIEGLYPSSAEFKKLVIFDHGLSQKALNDFWIQFKAS